MAGRVLGPIKSQGVVTTDTALGSIHLYMWNDVYCILTAQGICQSQIKLFFEILIKILAREGEECVCGKYNYVP